MGAVCSAFGSRPRRPHPRAGVGSAGSTTRKQMPPRQRAASSTARILGCKDNVRPDWLPSTPKNCKNPQCTRAQRPGHKTKTKKKLERRQKCDRGRRRRNVSRSLNTFGRTHVSAPATGPLRAHSSKTSAGGRGHGESIDAATGLAIWMGVFDGMGGCGWRGPGTRCWPRPVDRWIGRDHPATNEIICRLFVRARNKRTDRPAAPGHGTRAIARRSTTRIEPSLDWKISMKVDVGTGIEWFEKKMTRMESIDQSTQGAAAHAHRHPPRIVCDANARVKKRRSTQHQRVPLRMKNKCTFVLVSFFSGSS